MQRFGNDNLLWFDVESKYEATKVGDDLVQIGCGLM